METVFSALIGIVGTLCGTMIGVVAGIAGAYLQRRWALDDLRRAIAKRDVEELWMPIEKVLDKLLQEIQMTWLESQQNFEVTDGQRLEEIQRHLDLMNELLYEHGAEFVLRVLNDKPLSDAFNELFGIVNQLKEAAEAKDLKKVDKLVSEVITAAAVVRRRKREILRQIYKP